MDRLHSLVHRLRGWLYSGPARDDWQQPDRVIAALEIAPGAAVADIGSGGGYFTFRLAEAVGPSGWVVAVDTDRGLLEQIAADARERGLENVRTLPVDGAPPQISGGVDLAFASNAFHHLPDPPSYFAGLAASLRPDGRVAIIESRPSGFLRRLFGHATPPSGIRDAMERAGYRLEAAHDFLQRQSFQVFRRSGG